MNKKPQRRSMCRIGRQSAGVSAIEYVLLLSFLTLGAFAAIQEVGIGVDDRMQLAACHIDGYFLGGGTESAGPGGDCPEGQICIWAEPTPPPCQRYNDSEYFWNLW